MMNVIQYLQARLSTMDERGAAAVEYALLVTLIAIAIIGAITYLAGGITAAFNNVGDAITPG